MKGGQPQQKQPIPDPANLDQAELDSNQEIKAIPFIAGERKLATIWITSIYKPFERDGPVPEKKSFHPAGPTLAHAKGKTGGAATKNNYGSIAGLVCAGPVDELVSFIIDAKTVWPTNVGWADDIVGFIPINYSRTGNIARVAFSDSVRLPKGKFFVLTGMQDASFNQATPLIVHDSSDTVIKYNNPGPNVALTNTELGNLTKVVTYVANDLVRYGSGIWKCILGHVGTPDKAPPNVTYWAAYSIKRSDQVNPDLPYMFTVVDPMIAHYGAAYFYWGTPSQILRPNSFLAGSPPYRNCAFIELEEFLFGTERDGPPNIELVIRRRANQAIISGASAELNDGQVNPMAAAAEMITNPIFGLGQTNLLDAASFQAAADALSVSPSKTFLSVLIDSKITMREFIANLLAYCDGWLRFNSSGLIEAGLFAHNQAPPAFTDANTIDFNDVVDEIAYDPETWADTYSSTICKFQDRMRAFKDAGRNWKSGVNLEISGEAKPNSLDRQWITREDQALAYASEWGKIYAQRKISGELRVRAEKASTIRPGDLFLLTHDAASFSIVCRCHAKTIEPPPSGIVGITYESERGFAPFAFQPTIINPPGNAYPHPELISTYQFVQPPPALSGLGNFQLSILAARKSTLSSGFNTWFLVDDIHGDFFQLGVQQSWSVFGTLAQNYASTLPVDGTIPPDDDTETLQLTIDDLQAPEDIDAISAAQTGDSINDNSILVWLFKSSDPTQFEICTLKSIRLDGAVYKLKVRRQRYTTLEQDFLAGDSAFICFRDTMVYYFHEKFPIFAAAGSVATLRLQGFTVREEADLTDADLCPDISFTFTDPFAPTTTFILEQVNGVDIASFATVYDQTDVFRIGFNMFSPGGNITDANLIVKLDSTETNFWSQNFENTALAYGEATFSLPKNGTWSVCVVLRDSTGRVSRTFLVPVGGGALAFIIIEDGGSGASGTVLTPYALPTRRFSIDPFTCTLHSSTAGATIYYQIVTVRASTVPVEPTQTLPGAWTVFSTPIPIAGTSSTIHAYQRVWFFATHAGMTNSPTSFINY